MKMVLIAAAATLGMAGLALADEAKAPSVMSDAQMDAVVAGDHIRNTRSNTDFLFDPDNDDTGYTVIAGEAFAHIEPPILSDGQGPCNGVQGSGLSGSSC